MHGGHFFASGFILLRHSISGRLLTEPALRFARQCLHAWASAFLLALCTACGAQAETLNITVVQSEEGGAYAEFSEALRNDLAGKAVVHVLAGADKPLPSSGLVIAAGMKAAAAAAASDAPFVLNVLVPKAGQDKLLRDSSRHARAGALSAVYLDQPAQRQARLIRAVLPGADTVGLLYSAPPEALPRLRKRLSENGLKLFERQAGDTLIDALQDVLQHADVLLALPDAEIYNASTIRNVLLTAYNKNVPLIGFSPAYAKAGALCAIFSTPAQVAAQAAAMARKLEETGALPLAQYPQDFELQVNDQVARSLGLHVGSAGALRDEIRAGERDEP